MNSLTLTYLGARIVFHPNIHAYRGQPEGWGVYYKDQHSPETVARTLGQATFFIAVRALTK